MTETMAESPDAVLVEERRELMVPPTGGNPLPRTARFLKPSATSINGGLPSPPTPCRIPPSDPQKWPLKVSFHGWREKKSTWKMWVETLHSLHRSTWKKAGIYDGIMASVFEIRRDDDLVYAIVSKWFPETNTFVFPWGEATVTLEDVMILGGFPVLGESVSAPVSDREMAEAEAALVAERLEVSRTKSQKACQYGWMNRLKGSGTPIEHEAFLSMWLSRFVLPTRSNSTIEKHVFSIAVRLAKGIPVALGPAVLASIYRDLSSFKVALTALTKMGKGGCLEKKDNVFSLSLLAPLRLVQAWVWERFPALRPPPKPTESGEPRLARWDKMKTPKIKNVGSALDLAGGTFEWRPYTRAVGNWEFPKFYGERGEWVLMGSSLDKELQAFALFLRACRLVGLDGSTEWYFPHRVGMQFGMDQDIPCHAPLCNEISQVAWNNHCQPFNGVKFYIPSRLYEAGVTARYLGWWNPSLKKEGDDALVPPGFPAKRDRMGTGEGNGALDHSAFRAKRSRMDAGDSSSEDRMTIGEMYLKSISDRKCVRRNSGTGSTSTSKTGVARNDSLINRVNDIFQGVASSEKVVENANDKSNRKSAATCTAGGLKRSKEDGNGSDNSESVTMVGGTEGVKEKEHDSNIGCPFIVGESEKAMEDAIKSSTASNAATVSSRSEKTMEDTTKLKEMRSMSGIATVEIPGLDLEARISRLERVVAALKAQRFR